MRGKWFVKIIRVGVSDFRLTVCTHPQFFFSSRRRHTRCLSDRSSDVCSSDLFLFSHYLTRDVENKKPLVWTQKAKAIFNLSIIISILIIALLITYFSFLGLTLGLILATRSEERRVGKECRFGGSRYHDDKKYI